MRHPQDERGAVAVVAMVSLVMVFSCAAVAVDLGNAFVRKRDLQSQADFAALAGGPHLTDGNAKTAADPAVVAAADYLKANQPQDDTAPAKSAVGAAQLVDGAEANGEVYFPSAYKMRVVAPNALVEFGMAKAIGFDSVNVNAEATIGIEAPGKPLPFFLPKDCTSQMMQLKDSSNSSTSITFDPASGNGGTIARVDSVDPLTTPGLVASTLKVVGSRFDSTMVADFFQESTGDRIPNDPTASVPVTLIIDRPGNSGVDEASVELPPGVYNRPGAWLVRIDNGDGYSGTMGRFVVGNPTPPPATCGQSSTGDFGMLDSPRAGVTQLAEATAMNIAEGIDHALDLFAGTLPPEQADSCNGLGNPPAPGAQNDKISQPNNNCVGIKTGMNTDTVTDGLILGGTASVNGVSTTYTGLLDAPTTDQCSPSNTDAEKVRLGKNTNDDVLSCFLPAGVRVGDVTTSTVPTSAVKSISPKIFSSPRFAVVPVIAYAVNPQNGYYPLIGWQPVFITDESNASTKGNSFASSQNGVRIHSSKVVAVTVVPINYAALPDTVDYTGPTSPYPGVGPKVIRLTG